MATEISRGVLAQADRRDRTELLPLLDHVQPLPRTIVKWGGEDGPVAERTRTDLVPAANPSENEAVSQQFGYLAKVHVPNVVSLRVERAAGLEREA